MILRLLVGAVILTSPALAQNDSSAVPGFSGQGEGNWEMICHVLAGSELSNVILNVNHPRYSSRKLKKADCDYHAGANGELVITVIAAAECPFKGTTSGVCSTNVPKRRTGSFKFKAQSEQ